MVKRRLIIILRISALPSICVASARRPSPIRMETSEAEPAPTSVPNAVAKFMMGSVSPKPANAMAPTPCPMKIRSMMLYNEVAVVAMMAGRA